MSIKELYAINKTICNVCKARKAKWAEVKKKKFSDLTVGPKNEIVLAFNQATSVLY